MHSGTDFFLTDAGLVGSETTISGFSGFDGEDVPEFVRMHQATQDAATIDVVRGHPRGQQQRLRDGG